jgi:raffinose/stachyose/melibiose transport system substrate-binding protein
MTTAKITRRQMLKALGVASAGAALAACAPAAAPPAAPAAGEQKAEAQPTAVPPPAQQYTILHMAWNATPSDPNVELAPGQTRQVAYQKIADEWMAKNPNAKIEWYRFPAGTNFQEWILARMTAQDCPDIYWANTEDLWPNINKGWALDFTEYMNQANPYVQGNDKWVNQFEEIAVISQTGPDGKMYGVNMDGAGVLTVYNKKAFADAGIDKEPTTWAEYKAVWQKLLDKGWIPYGADISVNTCCFPHWFSAHTYCQLMWDDIYQWDDDKNRVITAKELATHAQKGSWPDWDAYLAMAKLMKEMVPYFPVGYEGQLNYRDLFRQSKVAMYMEGNWAITDFANSPPGFDIGWMHFPIITKDIWPKAPEKVVRIQGAWGAMQYHVPGYMAQKDPGKIPLIMDWLMYSSQPENVTAICAETSLVPLTKGATARPELAPFSAPYDRAAPYQSWCTLQCSFGMEAEYKNWQAYLPSDMSDAEFLDMAKKSLNEVVAKVIEQNPDWKV